MTNDLNNHHNNEYGNEYKGQKYETSQRSISSLTEASSSDGALGVEKSGFGLSRPRYRWSGRRICWWRRVAIGGLYFQYCRFGVSRWFESWYVCRVGVGGAIGWGGHCRDGGVLRCRSDGEGPKLALNTLATQKQRFTENIVKLIENAVALQQNMVTQNVY